MSVRQIHPVRLALWNPELVLRRWGFIRIFLCAFAMQTRVGGNSVMSFRVISLPPNQNCKRTGNQIKSVRPVYPFALPALLRAAALRTRMGFGGFDFLKPADVSFAENVFCRLSVALSGNLCKFAYGKLTWTEIQLNLSE